MNIMDTIQCEKKRIIMYYGTLNAVTTIKHCDHNYEISSYVYNPFCPVLIWPGNFFE